jgi:hypothetical protein
MKISKDGKKHYVFFIDIGYKGTITDRGQQLQFKGTERQFSCNYMHRNGQTTAQHFP